jgi:hypothetical protein
MSAPYQKRVTGVLKGLLVEGTLFAGEPRGSDRAKVTPAKGATIDVRDGNVSGPSPLNLFPLRSYFDL